MKSSFLMIIATALAISAVAGFVTGCAPAQQKAPEKQTVEVRRGDLQITITADGNLTMPHQSKLRFGTPGTVKDILVKEGDKVHTGTLLSKLDDTLQKIAVTSALYDVELALNELAERVYPSIMGYPHYYPTTSIVLRLEQAKEELKQTQDLLEKNKQKEAAAKLRIVQYDLQASLDTLQMTIKDTERYPFIANTYSQTEDISDWPPGNLYPNIPEVIGLIEQNLKTVVRANNLIERAEYDMAKLTLLTAGQELDKAYSSAKKVCGQIVTLGISYPDASTSLDSVRAAENRLTEIQKLIEKGSHDSIELSKILRMAQHDIEMSHRILQNNELIFRHGLNLKVLRQNNLMLQKYELALQKSKEDLMKTEILAPFDGTVVYIGVKENDQLSAYDYSSVVAIHLVDTKTIEIDGVVDEVDIFKVQTGQKANIVVDALPEKKLTGTVTFISPFGIEKAGVINYKVTLKLDPTETALKGSLTATAYISVDNRKNVLLIPNGAIKGSRGEYWTQVVADEAKDVIEKRLIVLGMQNDQFSEVKSGLTEGEKVIAEKITATRQSPSKQ
jgi:RND family efflux transporter MFP subunit